MSFNFYFKYIIHFVFVVVYFTANAQQNRGGVPFCYKDLEISNLMDLNITPINLPYVNNAIEEARVDSIEGINPDSCFDCRKSAYGIGLDVTIDIKALGYLQVLPDSGKLWGVKIESSTAYGMQFYFSKFKLPEGAKLFIYNEDRTIALGAYTSENNPIVDTNIIKFGTQYIFGNKIFIEYYEPVNPEFEGEVEVTKVIHIFRSQVLTRGPFGTSGDCNINVSCPEGNGWGKEINSVAMILAYDSNLNLAMLCSGSLLNNTDEDGRAYFLTAYHCLGEPNIPYDPVFNHSTWLFLFNHQSKNCNSTGSDVSAYLGQSVYGSILLAKDGFPYITSDYLLLELNTSEAILASYDACYAGWNRKPNTHQPPFFDYPQPPFVGISHPKGDIKKIAIDNDPLVSTLSGSENENTLAEYWMVNWELDKGVVESGSSGSPLFDFNHRVIGQLSLGPQDGCNGQINKGRNYWYGKFDIAWQEGGFGFWLDPFNTGSMTTNTYCAKNSSGNTGSGGGSGGGSSGGSGGTGPSSECWFPIGSEMSINNNTSSFPCVEGNITLLPVPTVAGCENAILKWRGKISIETQDCNEAPDDSKCKRKLLKPWRCDCAYVNYFIEITEVDLNLNPIGAPHSKWFSEQAPKHYVDFPNEDYLLGAILVDANKLVQLGISLQTGRNYRIKLATTNYVWKEDVRYFKYIPSNISITGNILGNLSAKDNITLTNVTINQPIEVMAGKLISIQPTTRLTAGHYYINGTFCDNNKSRLIFANTISEGSNSYSQNGSTESIDNKREISNANNKFDIFPNPTNGKVYINAKSKIEKIEIYNNIGIKVLNKGLLNEQLTEIDLNSLANGIYFVVLNIEGNNYFHKVIKQ